jgi:hypothetical protein
MMRGYIEDMKAILAKMEEKWAALEADVGMAPKPADTAPADPVVAEPVETPVEAPADAPVDDGSAANEPDPVADPTPDPITSPDDSGDAVQV